MSSFKKKIFYFIFGLVKDSKNTFSENIELLLSNFIALFKDLVQCFSMPVVMIECFFLNPEKNLAQIRLVVFEKNAKTAKLRNTPIPNT